MFNKTLIPCKTWNETYVSSCKGELFTATCDVNLTRMVRPQEIFDVIQGACTSEIPCVGLIVIGDRLIVFAVFTAVCPACVRWFLGSTCSEAAREKF